VLLGAFLLAIVGCGGHAATIAIAVTDTGGTPIAGATVWVVGTNIRGTTDAAGNVSLGGVKQAGVFDVKAGLTGYFQNDAQVTVAKGSDPAPSVIALSYSPPVGRWVYQPKSTEWVVLNVQGFDPWQVTVGIVEWGCFRDGWDQTGTPQIAQLDPTTKNSLDGAGLAIPIVGPDQLGTAWKLDPGDGTGAPDTAIEAEPPGACNGTSAMWDNSANG